MKLVEQVTILHSEEDIKDFDMDNEATVIARVEPFNLVVNCSRAEVANVKAEVHKALLTYITELSKQVDQL